jgi:hypothetical protein
MPALSYVHQLLSADTCQTTAVPCGGKRDRFTVPVVRARPLVPGVRTTTDQA